MIVAHPKAFTHVIVELLAPLRRGPRCWVPGHQFAVTGRLDRPEVVVCDEDGQTLVVAADRLRVVSTPKAADPPPERPRPTLAALKAAGLRRGSDLEAGS